VDLQEKDVGQYLPHSTLRNVRELVLGFYLPGPPAPPVWPQSWRELTQLTSLSVFCKNLYGRNEYYVPANLKNLGEILPALQELGVTTSLDLDSQQYGRITGIVGGLRLRKLTIIFPYQGLLSYDDEVRCLDGLSQKLCSMKPGTSVTQVVTCLRRVEENCDHLLDGARQLTFTFPLAWITFTLLVLELAILNAVRSFYLGICRTASVYSDVDEQFLLFVRDLPPSFKELASSLRAGSLLASKLILLPCSSS